MDEIDFGWVPALSPTLVVAVSCMYLLALFGIAYFGDWRAARGRSIIGNAWVYVLSLAVYCTAWSYFGSVGRAATGGVWFLPIYLGPTLAMVLAWSLLRKMVRIAKTYRITSIADFISSRYGKSPMLAGGVTLITVVGIVPYIALQLDAIAAGYAVLTATGPSTGQPWWHNSSFYTTIALAGFTMVFGTRKLDSTERHEGVVAAVAMGSVVKLVAFLAVGVFVTYGLFDGVPDITARALAEPSLARLLDFVQDRPHAHVQWFSLTLLAMMSVLLLPRQFQIMVVENVDERHLKRAAWAFPLYLLAINLFVLPIALGGLLEFGSGPTNPEAFVLTLPLAHGHEWLALLAFIGGVSAATGMVIVESIAVSTMVCNDLVMPLLLRGGARLHPGHQQGFGLSVLWIRRLAIVLVLMLGYAYYRLAGDAYALVSYGLTSFAAVAQFGPSLLGGMYWKGGTRHGALTGLVLGFLVWSYTMLLPSLARSGWMPGAWVDTGPWGIELLKPEELMGLEGLDNVTNALFWSLLLNMGAYVLVSLWRVPSARETSQALLFVDVFERTTAARPVFWQGEAKLADLQALSNSILGEARTRDMLDGYARQQGLRQAADLQADPRLVQFVETQLAGAVGAASARALVASVVQEDPLDTDDVMRILEEATRLRVHSQELEDKSRSLERAGAELRAANEKLKDLDRLKDDFMSSVTHELRTPLTSIRALSELMQADDTMPPDQRQQCLSIVVGETERLTRLVNQVLDMAKIESGQAEWHNSSIDMVQLIQHAVGTTEPLLRDRGAVVNVKVPEGQVMVQADPDRLTQVLLNLLSNAAKFVPSQRGRIEVQLTTADAGVQVEVTDNGPGVPKEQQALIFEKFRQGGDALHRPQGTGLGLPISRQIMAHLGGHMWLHSPPEGGACFGFFLPWVAPTTTNNTGETP